MKPAKWPCALRLCFLILAPVLEALFIRQAIQWHWGPDNIIIGVFGIDVLFPGAIAFAIVMWRLDVAKLFKIETQKPFIVANLILLFLTCLFLSQMDRVVSALGTRLNVLILLALSGTTILTSCFLFLEPKRFLKQIFSEKRLLSTMALLGIVVVIYPLVVKFYGHDLSWHTGRVAHALLSLTGPGYTFEYDAYIILRHTTFGALISQGCAGHEGIFFFFLFFMLLLLYENKKFGAGRIVAVAIGGALYMFVINVLRIVALYLVAVHLRKHFASIDAHRAFLWGFHSHIGWILYLLAIGVYFSIIARYRVLEEESRR